MLLFVKQSIKVDLFSLKLRGCTNSHAKVVQMFQFSQRVCVYASFRVNWDVIRF